MRGEEKKIMYLRLRLQGVLPVRPRERSDDRLFIGIGIYICITVAVIIRSGAPRFPLRLALLRLGLGLSPRVGQEGPPKRLAHKHAPDPARTLVYAGAQTCKRGSVRVPEPAADETAPGLHVNVVAGVGALAAGPRPPRGVVGLYGVRFRS